MRYKELESKYGSYRVYEDGTVESNARRGRVTKWHTLVPQVTNKGYYRVHLTLKETGAIKAYRVHRLVADLFLPKPEDSSKIFVNHKDGNKSNNHFTNLEWCTHAENMCHAKMLGLLQKERDVGGKAVRVTMEFPTASTAERALGLPSDTIARIARGSSATSREYPIQRVEYIV